MNALKVTHLYLTVLASVSRRADAFSVHTFAITVAVWNFAFILWNIALLSFPPRVALTIPMDVDTIAFAQQRADSVTTVPPSVARETSTLAVDAFASTMAAIGAVVHRIIHVLSPYEGHGVGLIGIVVEENVPQASFHVLDEGRVFFTFVILSTDRTTRPLVDPRPIDDLHEVVLSVRRLNVFATVDSNHGRAWHREIELDKLRLRHVELSPPELSRWYFLRK